MTGGGGMDRERVLFVSRKALERVERRLRTPGGGKFLRRERLTGLQAATRRSNEHRVEDRDRLPADEYRLFAWGNYTWWREEIVRLGMGDMLRTQRDEEDES